MNTLRSEDPDCEICGNREYLTEYYSKVTNNEYPGEFNFVRCQKCGLVFQSPRVLSRFAGQYYPPESYWGSGKILSNDRYDQIYKQILKRYPGKGNILDVGTGIGLFLTKFKQLGWGVTGTDISHESAIVARKSYKIPVLAGELIKLRLPSRKYDVVVLNHVLEHLYHPGAALRESRRLLKDSGLLVVALPNINGLGHKIFKSRWYSLQPGRHVWHFSPKTLTQLLSQSGFDIQEIKYSDCIHDRYAFYHSVRSLFSTSVHPVGYLTTTEVSGKNHSKKIFAHAVAVLSYLVAGIEKLLQKGDVMIFLAVKKPQ